MVECVNCAKFKWCDLSSPNVNECADYKETLTNEEYLRSCNTEQLAEALLNIMANNEFTLYLLHTKKKSVQEMKDAVVEWLKQPHHNEVEK